MTTSSRSKSWLTRVSRNTLFALLAAAVLVGGLGFTTAAPASAAATCVASHIVQRGETLFKIGVRYNVTWDRIARANNITTPNKIFAGQVLCIPAASTACRVLHTVVRGETLKKIGALYNVTWDAIARANILSNPNRIFPGQVLCIPASATTPTPTPTPAPERISFATGAISGSVQGTVTFPVRRQYLIRALKDQQMTVEIISNGNKANFAVQGVSDGQPLKRVENEDRKWTGRLTTNQDYLITVASPAGSSSYTLVITVTGP